MYPAPVRLAAWSGSAHIMKNIPNPDLLLHNLTVVLHHTKPRDFSSHFVNKVMRSFHTYTRLPSADVIFQICKKEYEAMARFNQSTFAALTLTREQERELQSWITKHDVSALDTLTKLTGDGFKVSISWVAEQNAFCFSIIGTNNTKLHRDMVMTSWSDDLEEVILIGGYKHYVICDGDTWPAQNTGQRWG